MSTALATVGRSMPLRAKAFVFTVIGLMMAYVLYHNESFIVNPQHPVWTHYEPFKWWLLPHGIAGGLALFLGPFQFSDRLRQRYAKVHRVAGRLYVAGVAVAAPLGFWIQHLEGPPLLVAATVFDAALWLGTTGIAFAYALQGKIQLHRQWMTRSFAVAMVFLEVRVILGLTGWERLGVDAVTVTVWGCVASAVFVGDVVLQIQEASRTRSATKAKVRVAVV